ncbi:MAG: hypothetical protein JWM80_4923 [Cyanobacteria bacterium RYN_339]|nr:hypothetical protein [Cyanobacteria bacterium RYN_339]
MDEDPIEIYIDYGSRGLGGIGNEWVVLLVGPPGGAAPVRPS